MAMSNCTMTHNSWKMTMNNENFKFTEIGVQRIKVLPLNLKPPLCTTCIQLEATNVCMRYIHHDTMTHNSWKVTLNNENFKFTEIGVQNIKVPPPNLRPPLCNTCIQSLYSLIWDFFSILGQLQI